MALSERRKGLVGEREVAAIYRAAGLTVRNLEGLGDHLVMRTGRPPVHSEVKRQERWQVPLWLRQAEAEAPPGTIAVVAFKQSGGDWYAALKLRELATILADDHG